MIFGCASALAAEPALTIYNQGFAVVRDVVPMELKAGMNEVSFSDTTAHVETDSVILRDPAGQKSLRIIEQNYRNDPVSQELLLGLYEGQTIDFRVEKQGEPDKIVKGKIIRSSYVPHTEAMARYGQQYYQSQQARAYPSGSANSPIIEVDGQLRFSLPGQPLFPKLSDETILKPTLNWVIETDAPAKLDAELAYITGGMMWDADYNLIAPPEGDTLDMIGWITMDNQSGKTFANARVKLMAGDVSKLKREGMEMEYMSRYDTSYAGGRPPVSEQTFDEYHLYTVERPTTLRDRQTKQVEFIRASGIKAERLYIYDGAKINMERYRNYSMESIRQEREYGTLSNPKIWVMNEFVNSKDNNLGLPLPKGKLRFYRRSTEGALEFTGENVIDHTPRDEHVRAFTGNAFDLQGERVRTDFKIDGQRSWMDESFDIRLRNHKKEPVEVRIVEHLYRGTNWEIRDKTHPFKKTDSQTMEFRVRIAPDAEEKVTYMVHYSW